MTPDTIETLRNYALQRFVEEAIQLKEPRMGDTEQEPLLRYTSFVMTGLHPDNGTRTVVDPIQDRISPEELDNHVHAQRDIDSFNSLTDNLPFVNSISVYPVPRFDDALKKNCHLTFSIVVPGSNPERITEAPLHKIPNIGIAKFDERGITRLFFPFLYQEDRVVPLTQGQMGEIYDLCMRPAIETVLPQEAGHWPPSYAAEMIRIQRHVFGRGLAHGTLDLPAFMVQRFGEELRDRVRALPFGENAFFLHTMRGTRGRSQHSPNDEDEMLAALAEYLSIFDVDLLDKRKCWIDIGLEYRSPGNVLQLRTDGHLHLVSEVLGLSSERDASRLTSVGSTLYSRDLAAQLDQISGFRLTTNTAGRRSQVIYMNVYTTDKSPTYLVDNGKFSKYITATEVLNLKPGKDIPFVERMKTVYQDAALNADGHLRVEARVSLEKARECLLSLSRELLLRSVVSFPREVWYGFKIVRLEAMEMILRYQLLASPSTRSSKAALSLSGIIAYSMTTLNSRFGDGSFEKDILRVSLPHKQPDYNDPDFDGSYATVPFNPCGMFVIWKLCMPPVTDCPRLATGKVLSIASISAMFGGSTYEALVDMVDPVGISPAMPACKGRVPNKASRTTQVYFEEGDLDAPLFRLEAEGYTRPTNGYDDGEDQDADDNEGEDKEDNLDKYCTRILLMFAHDVIARSPNPRSAGEPSYVSLSLARREDIKDNSLLSDMALSNIFKFVSVKESSKAEWTRHFDRLFPKKGATPISDKSQGYRQSSYWRMHVRLVTQLSREAASSYRTQLKAHFDEFKWIPDTASDRMWQSKSKSKGTVFPKNHVGPAALVVLGPKVALASVQWEDATAD